MRVLSFFIWLLINVAVEKIEFHYYCTRIQETVLLIAASESIFISFAASINKMNYDRTKQARGEGSIHIDCVSKQKTEACSHSDRIISERVTVCFLIVSRLQANLKPSLSKSLPDAY